MFVLMQKNTSRYLAAMVRCFCQVFETREASHGKQLRFGLSLIFILVFVSKLNIHLTADKILLKMYVSVSAFRAGSIQE